MRQQIQLTYQRINRKYSPINASVGKILISTHQQKVPYERINKVYSHMNELTESPISTHQ